MQIKISNTAEISIFSYAFYTFTFKLDPGENNRIYGLLLFVLIVPLLFNHSSFGVCSFVIKAAVFAGGECQFLKGSRLIKVTTHQ